MGKQIYFCTQQESLLREVSHFLEKRLQFESSFFSSAETVKEAIIKEHPLLLIVDQYLEDISGDELVFTLQSEPELKTIPTLILLEDDRSEIIERCLLAGCSDYMISPPDLQILTNKIARLLNLPFRKEMRIVFRCWLKGRILSQFFFGNSLDISMSGMLFSTDVALNVNDILEITFFLPASTTKITISCKIVRMEQSSGSEDFKYGVQFLHMDETNQRFMKDYLEKIKSRQM